MKRIPALLLIMALGLGILTGTAVAEAWSCPECGQEENNGNFCTNCGKRMDLPRLQHGGKYR